MQEKKKNIHHKIFNEDLEKELLGLILLDNKNLEIVDLDINSDFFYSDINKEIFQATEQLIERNIKADTTTVYYSLNSKSILHDDELKKYLENLLDYAIGSFSSPSEIIKVLHFLSLKRSLYNISHYVLDELESSSINDIEVAINNIENRIFNITNNSSINNDFKNFEQYSKILKQKFQIALESKKLISGIKTNLTDLDSYTGGLQKSDLIIIAARPSMGKTALAVTMIRNIARNFIHEKDDIKKSIAFFSLEMSGEQVGVRIVAMESKQSTKAVHTGRKGIDNEKLNAGDVEEIHQAFEETSRFPLFIDDTPSLNIALLKSRCRYLKKKHNIEVIFIDYLQLLKATNSTSGQGNRVLEIAEITQTLKAIAKELNVPVIALSQLSRAVETRDDKKPQLSDLRESGTIEQDADIVMFLYRKAYYLEREEKKVIDENNQDEKAARDAWLKKYEPVKNVAEIVIAKNRNGPVGSVLLHFAQEKMEFSNLENQHYLEYNDEGKKSFKNNTVKEISNDEETDIPDDLRNVFKKS